MIRSLVLCTLVSALALMAPASASAFTCPRHSAPVSVTGGHLVDVSTGEAVTDRIDDAGTYELQKGATAVVTVAHATATITGLGSKAAFRFSCYRFHSDPPQSLMKMYFGKARVRAPNADAKKIGVSTLEGIANMTSARPTDFTVSRREGLRGQRTYVRAANGAGAVLVGAMKNLAHRSPCTGGRRLVIEPDGRIHPG
jgi:hypothetical protein